MLYIFSSIELRKDRRANLIQFPTFDSNLKEPLSLADPIQTQGHTHEVNCNFTSWEDMNSKYMQVLPGQIG